MTALRYYANSSAKLTSRLLFCEVCLLQCPRCDCTMFTGEEDHEGHPGAVRATPALKLD